MFCRLESAQKRRANKVFKKRRIWEILLNILEEFRFGMTADELTWIISDIYWVVGGGVNKNGMFPLNSILYRYQTLQIFVYSPTSSQFQLSVHYHLSFVFPILFFIPQDCNHLIMSVPDLSIRSEFVLIQKSSWLCNLRCISSTNVSFYSSHLTSNLWHYLSVCVFPFHYGRLMISSFSHFV